MAVVGAGTDSLAVDYQNPVLDLSYRDIRDIQINQVCDGVQVLILTGNRIIDFSFMRWLPNIKVLHADNLGINEFSDMDLAHLKGLRHLIVRMNGLSSFDGLCSLEELKTLDVSQNQFGINAEASLTTVQPSLARVVFGFVSGDDHSSYTNLNTFRLFLRLFLERYYDQEAIHIANMDRCPINNVVFSANAYRDKLRFGVGKIDDRAVIQNLDTIVTVYQAIVGFEIGQLHQQIVRLQQIANGEIEFNTGQHAYRFIDYQTVTVERQPDQQVFMSLEARKRESYYNRAACYLFITFEYDYQVALLTYDQANGCFVQFEQVVTRLQQKILSRQSQPKILVTYDAGAPDEQPFPAEPSAVSFSKEQIYVYDKVNIIQNGGKQIVLCNYYATAHTQELIIAQIREQIAASTGDHRIAGQTIKDLLYGGVAQFNKQERLVMDSPDKETRQIYLVVQYQDLHIPVQVDIELCGQVPLNSRYFSVGQTLANRYLLCQIQYEGGRSKTIISEQMVRYVPKIASVCIQEAKEIIICSVYELVDDDTVAKSAYRDFFYNFFCNNQLIKQSNEGFVDLLKERLRQDGVYRCVVQARNSNGMTIGEERQSNDLVLRFEQNDVSGELLHQQDEKIENVEEVEENVGEHKYIESDILQQLQQAELTRKSSTKVQTVVLGHESSSSEPSALKQLRQQQMELQLQRAKLEEQVHIQELERRLAGIKLDARQASTPGAAADGRSLHFSDLNPGAHGEAPAGKPRQGDASGAAGKKPQPGKKAPPAGSASASGSAASGVPPAAAQPPPEKKLTQPIAVHIERESSQLGANCLLQVRPACGGGKPRFQLFSLADARHCRCTTGLCYAASVFDAREHDGLYRVEVQFRRGDIGKRLFLHVELGENVQWFFPISSLPLAGDVAPQRQISCTALVPDAPGKVEKASIELAADGTTVLRLGKQSVVVSREDLHAYVLTAQIMAAGQQSLSLLTAQSNYYSHCLQLSFGHIINIGDRKHLFNAACEGPITKQDKTGSFKIGQLIVVQNKNICYIFGGFQDRNAAEDAVLSIQEHAGQLFNQQSREWADIVDRYKDQNQFDCQETQQEVAYTVKYKSFQVQLDDESVLTGHEYGFSFGSQTYQLQEEYEPLFKAFRFQLLLAQKNRVVRVLRIADGEEKFRIGKLDAGMKLVYIEGTFVQWVHEQKDVQSFIYLENEDVEKDVYDRFEQGLFEEQVTVVIEQKEVAATVKSADGGVVIEWKNNKFFVSEQQEPSIDVWEEDGVITVNNGERSLTMRAPPERVATVLAFLNLVGMCTYYM